MYLRDTSNLFHLVKNELLTFAYSIKFEQMKKLNFVLSIFTLLTLISCGTSLPEEYEGVYLGSSPAHEMSVNGNFIGMIPNCEYTINIMSGNKIRLQENCEDNLPTNQEGSFEIISSTETSYTLDYKLGEMSTGTIILNNDGTGKQITYDPQVELKKQ